MDKINPLSYVVNITPVPEEVLDASGWFATEYMEVSSTWVRMGPSMVSPLTDSSHVAHLLSQGWTIYQEDGPSQINTISGQQSNTREASASRGNRSEYGSTGVNTRDVLQVAGSTYQFSNTSTETGWREDSPSDSSNESSTVETDGQIWQHAYRLKRRRLQSDLALQDMITELTDAYNEGRSINDQRYDEIVTIYNVMLDQTEDEMIDLASKYTTFETLIEAILGQLPTDFASFETSMETILGQLPTDFASFETSMETILGQLPTDFIDYKTLVETVLEQLPVDFASLETSLETILGQIPTDFTTYKVAVDDLLDGYGEAETVRINTRFDGELAKLRNDLISRGLYSSMLWNNISIGIERERTLVLADLNDRISDKTIIQEDKIYTAQTAMRNNLISVREQLYNIKTAMRNSLISAYEHLHTNRTTMRNNLMAVYEQLYTAQTAMWNSLVAIREQLYTAKTSMRNNLVSARERLHALKRDTLITPLDIRNKVLHAMLAFMERRQDEYPQLSNLPAIVAQFGYGGHGTVNS